MVSGVCPFLSKLYLSKLYLSKLYLSKLFLSKLYLSKLYLIKLYLRYIDRSKQVQWTSSPRTASPPLTTSLRVVGWGQHGARGIQCFIFKCFSSKA
ncbi:hypothetical protein TrRE_jg4280 [Triparma retinervis]|uniref:Uncharacterized protein n=1 Tax=Triparma retinervis TaxID=2557542 RepID=A0A9W6ZK79_9STRA|nr:hypothetical protein TrRE_jg4280 [Triparma retinervis]